MKAVDESEVDPIRNRTVHYACICGTGKVRSNNEDNFYCGSRIRDEIYSDGEVSFCGTADTGSDEIFCVFDGMGGEACGEIASYVAADGVRVFVKENNGDTDGRQYLSDLAEALNDKILDETEDRSLVLMGTTAAMLRISGREVCALNVGDSRVYKFSGRTLSRISADHTARGSKALTKFLGLPRDYALSPYISEHKVKSGDIYLLCSDGVTDMLTDMDILDIIESGRSPMNICRALNDSALERGGVDNITAILIRIS